MTFASLNRGNLIPFEQQGAEPVPEDKRQRIDVESIGSIGAFPPSLESPNDVAMGTPITGEKHLT
jgi:hypothetical protein